MLDRRARAMGKRLCRFAVAFLVVAGTARAQSSVDSSLAGAGQEEAAQRSPRVSLAHYIELCRQGDYQQAAGYLDLSAADESRGAELARRLKVVLDRHVWFDLATVSALPDGQTDDDLPPRVDEIARIPGPSGSSDAVRIVRLDAADRWVFSRATVKRIDSWYGRLDNRWLLDRVPLALLRPGPGELLYWQWLALLALVGAAWGVGLVAGRLTRFVVNRIVVRRTRTTWDDEVVARLGGPLTLGWMLATYRALLPWLGLYEPAEKTAHGVLRTGVLLVVFWAFLRVIDVARQVVASSRWAADHPGVRSLLPLGSRVGKVVVLVFAFVALLSELGYPVASLVAGLGIGGLALALAAQKTVENLFGAFSIGADQPFREGDFVRIEDFVGTVEGIGLRSTRIRTLDRTLVTIPNGKLADMRLESLTERDRMRLACTVGLVYGTTAAQMRRVLDGLERTLRSHPKIWPDAVVVRFKEFGDSSLNIEVMAWFQTPEWSEFQLIRQDVLLEFMDVVEKAGSSFAFPTRTVHVVTDPGAYDAQKPSAGAGHA